MPQLAAADKKSNWFEARRVNVVKWETPVAKQYNCRGLPGCIIYDPEGYLVEEMSSQACWMAAHQPKRIKDL